MYCLFVCIIIIIKFGLKINIIYVHIKKEWGKENDKVFDPLKVYGDAPNPTKL